MFVMEFTFVPLISNMWAIPSCNRNSLAFSHRSVVCTAIVFFALLCSLSPAAYVLRLHYVCGIVVSVAQ